MLYTLLMLLAGLSIGPFMAFCMPGHYFAWYPLIPLFFYLFCWISISMVKLARRSFPERIRLYYLYSRFLKMIFSVIFLTLYLVFVGEHRTEFFIVFLTFYVICLLFESWFVTKYEEQQRREMINRFYQSER